MYEDISTTLEEIMELLTEKVVHQLDILARNGRRRRGGRDGSDYCWKVPIE